MDVVQRWQRQTSPQKQATQAISDEQRDKHRRELVAQHPGAKFEFEQASQNAQRVIAAAPQSPEEGWGGSMAIATSQNESRIEHLQQLFHRFADCGARADSKPGASVAPTPSSQDSRHSQACDTTSSLPATPSTASLRRPQTLPASRDASSAGSQPHAAPAPLLPASQSPASPTASSSSHNSESFFPVTDDKGRIVHQGRGSAQAGGAASTATPPSTRTPQRPQRKLASVPVASHPKQKPLDDHIEAAVRHAAARSSAAARLAQVARAASSASPDSDEASAAWGAFAETKLRARNKAEQSSSIAVSRDSLAAPAHAVQTPRLLQTQGPASAAKKPAKGTKRPAEYQASDLQRPAGGWISTRRAGGGIKSTAARRAAEFLGTPSPTKRIARAPPSPVHDKSAVGCSASPAAAAGSHLSHCTALLSRAENILRGLSASRTGKKQFESM